MVEEVISYINKKVAITLINGKERNGTIIGIDTESNSIKLKDENGIQASLLISMIGMLEPFTILNGNIDFQTSPTNEKTNSISSNVNGSHQKSQEAVQKITKLEILYETEIRNTILSVSKPDFETPADIKKITYSSISEENKLWINLKNKYDSAVKLGRLLPNSDELRAITNLALSLSENPKLSDSATIQNYVGYFYYLNKNKVEAIKSYQKSAKLSNKPNEWLNLAAIALEKEENELACLALEKLFLIVSCTEGVYEKAWYKFTELVIKFSAYSSFKTILERGLLKSEYEKIFETICYCLIKSDKKQIVETQFESSLSNDNFKALVSDNLVALPQQPVSTYLSFKLDFNKVVEKPIIAIPKPIKSQGQKNIFSTYSKPKYVDILKEARTARDLTKDYEKAEKLFTEGIEKEYDQVIKQRAIRDLASMLAQQTSQPQKAIDLLEKYQKPFTDSDLNLLYTFNFQLGEYEEAVKIQKELLKNTPRKDLRMSRYNLIASCYFNLSDYIEAERNYQNALKINPSNVSIKRNIALCFFQQGNIERAKAILNEIIEEFSDINAQRLLDKIEGKNDNLTEDLFIDSTGLAFENIDSFTNYFIQICDLQYINDRLIDNKYIGSESDKKQDLRRLEELALNAKARIAEVRSNIYLNAARLLFDLGEIDNDFYKYLCRSFTSKGDNAVQANSSPDTIKTFYLASLKIYDSVYFENNSSKQTEVADAILALCRLLYSFIGKEKISFGTLSIKETIEDVFKQHPDSIKLFNALKIIFAKSPQYAMNRVLQVISNNTDLKTKACKYLQINESVSTDVFVERWRVEAKKVIKIENEISEQISSLRNFQISELWLSSSIDKIKFVMPKVIFDSDKDYLQELQSLLDLCISLCNALSFDDKNRRCEDITSKAESFLSKIEKNPTKFSIEDIHSIIKQALKVLKVFLGDLYQTSKPELVFSSAILSYQLKENNLIDLQIKIENISEGHAEQVEYVVMEDTNAYELVSKQNVGFGTIRGKAQQIEIVTLRLLQEAIEQKAFTVKSFAKYKTGENDNIALTQEQEISVQLGNPEDFIPADNKYATYAESAEVKEDDMFFGRENIINNIYNVVCNNYKSFVFYGQKRAGKSSILYHLEKRLRNNTNVLVANIGNIGGVIDENSKTPLLYQMLFEILNKIKYAVEDKEYDGVSSIDFTFPSDIELYSHPNPLQYFRSVLQDFKRKSSRLEDWKNVRTVVLIDEFTYIYHLIVSNRLSNDFMINWKALLQENYFSVVLVAQDFYPKFKALDANAFQTMQSDRVSYLAEDEAKQLIDRPIWIKGESRYAEKAIDRIYELTAGSPFYIQIFCDKLVEYVNDEKVIKITEANVNKVLKGSMMKLDKGVFDNLINDGDTSPDAIKKEDSEAILRQVAKHTNNQPYCNKSQISHPSLVNIGEVLNNLVQREVLEINRDGLYRIRVGLFKDWLNENPL
jgi:tetratricopeptide (TPR) repeat protein